MEELREILKTEDLTQTEYQGRTFEVLIKSFKTHKRLCIKKLYCVSDNQQRRTNYKFFNYSGN